MIFGEKLKEDNKIEKKSIPSKVFYNHFHSMAYFIENSPDKYDLKKILYFNKLELRNENFEIDTIKKLLANAWSTEYACSLAKTIDIPDYYRYSMHWSFPQAYYSVYLTMSAFHETQGIANEQHEKSIKLFGNSVKDKHYPEAISFFCRGFHNDFEIKGLEGIKEVPKDFYALSEVNSMEEAKYQIASFLKSTRKMNAEGKRRRLEKNNDRRFQTSKKTFRKTFKKEHWDLIYSSIPETTVFNMLYRLRVKSNYHDVETFINADIDFVRFYQNLNELISYLNFVHEAYICKVIGIKEYEKILKNFPSNLSQNTALKRLDNYIRPLFK